MHKIFLFSLFLFSVGCQPTDTSEDQQFNTPDITGAQPFLLSSNESLYMSWQEETDSINTLKYCKYSNGEWSEPVTLASGKDWFINWADFPSISVNEAGNLISHYLPKSGSSAYAYDINIVLSQPDTSYKVHDDTVAGEHGFVSTVPYKGNKFMISWLDGRNASVEDHHHAGAMNLRAAVIGPTGEKEEEWLLDSKVCDCCQTSMAMTSNGPVVVYRDRSGEEIRDIAIRRYTGNFWTASKKVAEDNWKIAGCPVNGPKVIASGDLVVVGWYTGKDNNTTVNFAISDNSGTSFSSPVAVSNNTLGRVDMVLDDEKNIWISHISMESDKAVLTASKYNPEGDLLDEIKVAELDESRSTGFPQMEILDEKLYFAWTENADNENESRIKLKTISL